MFGWLYSIMRNLFRDEIRSGRRIELHGGLQYAEDIVDPADPQRILELKESFDAIAARPDAGLLMQAGLGASTEELAEQFGLSADNVRQTLSRGRKALREQYGKQVYQ